MADECFCMFWNANDTHENMQQLLEMSVFLDCALNHKDEDDDGLTTYKMGVKMITMLIATVKNFHILIMMYSLRNCLEWNVIDK